ncbi:MAG: DUF1385 domain-containing protein [Phascolarctobacterium sp.]|nr:DUF1385 domain-containing protein [Candidatus Phascolarctobacterium equi]
MSECKTIGGQAVIEGVMMRSPELVSLAVRCPDGSIHVECKSATTIRDKYPILGKPFLRGVVVLWESLCDGMVGLERSAQMSVSGTEEEMTKTETIGTVAIAVVLAVGLFIVVPTWSMRFLHTFTADPLLLNLAEGLLRMAIFLAYVIGISQMEDIRRVFQYHGAEHKTIYTYEKGLPLIVENVRPQSTLHPRCGTNFLMIVMLISMFVFAFFGWPNVWERIASRIILMPVIAGVSYEVIRFAGRNYDNGLVRALIMPGLLLQKVTTRQPDDDQIEVAIAAVKSALGE